MWMKDYYMCISVSVDNRSQLVKKLFLCEMSLYINSTNFKIKFIFITLLIFKIN